MIGTSWFPVALIICSAIVRMALVISVMLLFIESDREWAYDLGIGLGTCGLGLASVLGNMVLIHLWICTYPNSEFRTSTQSLIPWGPVWNYRDRDQQKCGWVASELTRHWIRVWSLLINFGVATSSDGYRWCEQTIFHVRWAADGAYCQRVSNQ